MASSGILRGGVVRRQWRLWGEVGVAAEVSGPWCGVYDRRWVSYDRRRGRYDRYLGGHI